MALNDGYENLPLEDGNSSGTTGFRQRHRQPAHKKFQAIRADENIGPTHPRMEISIVPPTVFLVPNFTGSNTFFGMV